MTEIDALKMYFKTCPFLDVEGEIIKVDMLSENTGETRPSYTLTVLPSEPWYKRYVDGGGIKKIVFAFQSCAFFDADSDENTKNIDFYMRLAEWIEENNRAKIYPSVQGAFRLECMSNGYLMYSEGSSGNYQIQLQLLYCVD